MGHERIPIPTADEQTALELENAEAEARWWDGMSDMHAATARKHKGRSSPPMD